MAWYKPPKTNPKNNTIKILSIGNSFSQDAQSLLREIAESANVSLIAANLYAGGENLEGHWGNANTNAEVYEYRKRVTGQGMTERLNTSIEYGVLDEDWDIITFQQASQLSGYYYSYQPYLNNLKDYVSNLVTNPNVKYGFHSTWAYAKDTDYAGFVRYNYDQENMYQSIVDATKKAVQESDLDLVIPTGTAIQNARQSKRLANVNDNLTHDGVHLDDGMGDYIAGLTFFASLLPKSHDIDLFQDVTYIPTNGDKLLAHLAKVAVINAVNKPFETYKPNTLLAENVYGNSDFGRGSSYDWRTGANITDFTTSNRSAIFTGAGALSLSTSNWIDQSKSFPVGHKIYNSVSNWLLVIDQIDQPSTIPPARVLKHFHKFHVIQP